MPEIRSRRVNLEGLVSEGDVGAAGQRAVAQGQFCGGVGNGVEAGLIGGPDVGGWDLLEFGLVDAGVDVFDLAFVEGKSAGDELAARVDNEQRINVAVFFFIREGGRGDSSDQECWGQGFCKLHGLGPLQKFRRI